MAENVQFVSFALPVEIAPKQVPSSLHDFVRLLATATPLRVCRRMIRTWRCRRRRRPSPSTVARVLRDSAARRQWTCIGHPWSE